MYFKFLPKKILAAASAAVVGTTLAFAAQPAPAAQANWGSLIGAGIQYIQLNKAINYYNNDGRGELFQQLKDKYGVNEDPDLNGRLDRIMVSVSASIAATDPSINQKPYNYFINNETTFNAFCTLGHNLSVNKGLFDLLSSEDEAAVVIAHEMAHGQKDHPVKGYQKSLPYEIIAQIYADSRNSTAGNQTAAIFANYATATQVTKPQEWEADNLAFDYISGSGYNPGACAALWQRVIEKQGESATNFVGEIFSPSDHPSNAERLSNYEKKLTQYSNGVVTVSQGVVKVHNKTLLAVGDIDGISGKERAYFIAGNLAAVYHAHKTAPAAYVSGDIVYLGEQPILLPQSTDPSAASLAEDLNRIK